MSESVEFIQPQYSKGKLRLIEASLTSLMEDGADGASIRKICERADVSIGLVNYHFTSIDGLLAASYKHLSYGILYDAILQTSPFSEDPRRQLSAFLEGVFGPKVIEPKVLRAWLVFWGMVGSSDAIRSAHDEANSASWNFLEGVISELNERSRIALPPRMAAIGLSSMIDGLWLEKCLQPDNFSAVEAIRLCEFWIDAIDN